MKWLYHALIRSFSVGYIHFHFGFLFQLAYNSEILSKFVL